MTILCLKVIVLTKRIVHVGMMLASRRSTLVKPFVSSSFRRINNFQANVYSNGERCLNIDIS